MAGELQGALGGAAAGSAIAPGIGTAIGAGVGLLGGLFGSSAEAHQRKMQAAELAAQQRAAPYLAAAKASNAPTQAVNFQDNGAQSALQGAFGGIQQAGALAKAGQENDLRSAMLQKLMGNNPAAAAQQISGLDGLKVGLNDDSLSALLAQSQG